MGSPTGRSAPARSTPSSDGAGAHNLPTALTSFLGRDVELEVAAGLLRERRLVTFHGAGGCGKTRLAVEAARSVAECFPDGTWFVDLTAATDEPGVARSVLGALGLDEVQGVSPEEQIAGYLGDTRSLLVLDNCEQAVAAVSRLAWRVVQRCGRAQVLATSREPLGIEGEAVYRVPSLAVPTDGRDTGCASVQLFLDRALLSNEPVGVAVSDLPDVVGICSRLDGIPLAIELAAAACSVLTPPQIAVQLAERLDPLGGSRTPVARHRTLTASIEWSYQLLDEDEQRVLRALAVFAGGFTLAAAEAVCASDDVPAGRAVEIVGGLVRKSLVERREGGPEPRFGLLETVRQYLRGLLVARGDEPKALRRHAAYVLTLVEGAGSDLPGSLTWLTAELGNIRAADEWFWQAADVEAALRLHGALHLFWPRRFPGEGLQRAGRALELSGGSAVARVRAWLSFARCAFYAGRIELAEASAPELSAAVPALTDDCLRGEVLSMSGFFGFLGGDLSGVVTQQRALALLGGPSYLRVECLMRLGVCSQLTGEVEEARRWFSESAAEADRLEQPYWQALSLAMLAGELTSTGELREAEALFAKAEQVFAELRVSQFIYRASLARVIAARGRLAEALAQLEADSALARYRGHRWHGSLLAWARVVIEHDHLSGGPDLGQLAEAVALLEANGGITSWGAVWLVAIQAEILAAAGDTAGAGRLAESAAVRAEQPVNRRARRRVWLAQSRIRLAEGAVGAAEQLAHTALRAALDSGATGEAMEALELLACLGDPAHAQQTTRLLAAAASAREERGYPLPPNAVSAVDAATQRAREALGPEGFDEAWAQGAGMTLADAGAYASRGRGGRRRPEAGWDSLTPTELQVVNLVAHGLRNADVAKAMFVSPATVKTHLISIFRKLDVSTRSELTAVVLERDS